MKKTATQILLLLSIIAGAFYGFQKNRGMTQPNTASGVAVIDTSGNSFHKPYAVPPLNEMSDEPGCAGPFSDVLLNVKGYYYAPFGGVSAVYDPGGNNNVYIIVLCDANGKVGFETHLKNLAPEGADVSWSYLPFRDIVCDDGGPEPGVWYRITSDKELIALQRYSTALEYTAQDVALKFVYKDGYIYNFQFDNRPPNPLDLVPVVNPGGFLHCTKTSSPL